MVTARLDAVLPEWGAFAHAVQARRPDSGTWCEGWTVRDLLIHQTGNAEELHRVLAGHLAGHPVATRTFDERERPYRTMTDIALWAAFIRRCEQLATLSEDATSALAPDTDVIWTQRTVTPSFFAEHLRQELILHRWDMTGDDDTATHALMQPWMTDHTVRQVGKPLLARGTARLGLGPDDRMEARLRAPGTNDVVVTAAGAGTTIDVVPPTGEATLESDPAVRVLLLWGRRPADPSRWRSQADPETLRRARMLLSGY